MSGISEVKHLIACTFGFAIMIHIVHYIKAHTVAGELRQADVLLDQVRKHFKTVEDVRESRGTRTDLDSASNVEQVVPSEIYRSWTQ